MFSSWEVVLFLLLSPNFLEVPLQSFCFNLLTSVNTQEKCWYTIWYFWEFNCVVQDYLCSRVGALTVNKNKPLIKSWLTRINQHESRNLNLCYWLTQNETTKLSDFVIIPYELSWYQHLNKVYKILIIFFNFLLEKLVNVAWLLE